MNERLADLTPAEILEAATSDPRIVQAIAAKDPRVQLMEKLYGDPDAKKAVQKHSKRLFPNASVPEIDIPELVRSELKDDLQAIKDLRTTLETDAKGRRHTEFRAKLLEAGAETEDLDAIETFMVENEIGPKSLGVAIEKFYASKELAEPNAPGLSPDLPLDGKDEHMKVLLATGPSDDLDEVNAPWVSKVFDDMFGAQPRRRAAR
jgi:hypothetical protein